MPPPVALTSWADEAEEERKGRRLLPSPFEIIKNKLKIVTDYKYTSDEKIEKRVRSYKIEQRLVPKSVAARKKWEKFGDSAQDEQGPNPSNTFYDVEEIRMQFISLKDANSESEECSFDKLKEQKVFVKCRHCCGNHWSLHCPFKDLKNKTNNDENFKFPSTVGENGRENNKNSNKYVPPILRENINPKKNDNLNKIQDGPAILIDNLPPNTTDLDLEELVKHFGPISKFYFPKNRNTGLCKGFAFIHFKSKLDAMAAIKALDEYRYDHSILQVSRSKSNK